MTELLRDATLLRAVVASDAADEGMSPTKAAAFVLLCEAELARVEASAAADRWQQVVDAFDHLRSPHLGAYARFRLAESLLTEGGRRTDAERVAREALAVADELGATPLAREVESLARRARLVVAAPDEPAGTVPPPSAPDRLGLSPREVEVLELLVEGRTNREIAEALFITEKTAGHHVSNILAKLDVRGRVEAAAAAIRLGIGSR